MTTGGQFSFAQCFVKYWVLHEFYYLRAVKYTSFEFLHAYLWELLLEESKPTVFLCSLLSQSSSLLLTLYVRVEAVFCSVQKERETECYAGQVLTSVLIATLVWHNVGHQPSCPRDTENKDTLCIHLEDQGPVQPPKDLHRSTICAPSS